MGECTDTVLGDLMESEAPAAGRGAVAMKSIVGDYSESATNFREDPSDVRACAIVGRIILESSKLEGDRNRVPASWHRT
jgi:hypothetical protein